MTTFINGPAAGVTLQLRRAPMLLRAVKNAAGQWDALDQLGDEPKSDEEIHVYRLAAPPTGYHLRMSGKRKHLSGMYQRGDYRLADRQPADSECRTTEAWNAWCVANADLVADLLTLKEAAKK
jgi:hypothetical protein